jgi:phosphoadenosine phosphosulfate reductase
MRQSHKRGAHNRPLMALPATQEGGIDAALAAKSEAAVALLRDALREYGSVVYANSLGAEAMVLTDLICTAVPAVDIFSIDTGRLPEETLSLLDRLERRYQRRIPLFYPDTQQVERFVRESGVNGFYDSLGARLRCCEIRKVEPFKRAIAGYGAWVTGVRRDQSETRSQAQSSVFDQRYGLGKISPLLDWTEAEVWAYIRARKLPYNPLHDRGYPSIGCAPCTRAIEPGQDHRAGRWWWEHPESRECGLHPRTRPTAVS